MRLNAGIWIKQLLLSLMMHITLPRGMKSMSIISRNTPTFITDFSSRFGGNDVLHSRQGSASFRYKTAQNGKYILDYVYNFCGRIRTNADKLKKFCSQWKNNGIYLRAAFRKWMLKRRYTKSTVVKRRWTVTSFPLVGHCFRMKAVRLELQTLLSGYQEKEMNLSAYIAHFLKVRIH